MISNIKAGSDEQCSLAESNQTKNDEKAIGVRERGDKGSDEKRPGMRLTAGRTIDVKVSGDLSRK